MDNKRENFGTSFGVIVALAGSAIGLGNLWRFPYLVGSNGGAAFVLIYIFFSFLLCLPILMSEFLVGKKGQANVYRMFQNIVPGRHYGLIGLVEAVAGICIIAFYSVIGGWTVDYLVKSLTLRLNVTGEAAVNIFNTMVTSSWEPLVYMLVFILLTGGVLLGGVKNGIEKFSKVMMPVLFVMIILIAVRSLTLEGSMEGVRFLFKPDFSKVTAETFSMALGQSFFSLSIGCGAILTYASYVKKEESIIRSTSMTALSDTVFALIASVAIMPAVFAFGISPEEGPGLAFIIIPEILSQIPGGAVMAIIFFFVLLIAALTSSISMLEVSVTILTEEFRMKRVRAVVLAMTVITLLGSLSSLSQGVLADVKLFGFNIFDFFDFLSANILMPLGGLLVVLFVGWVMKKPEVIGELTNGGTLKIRKWLYMTIYAIIRYVAPIIVVTVMVLGFLD